MLNTLKSMRSVLFKLILLSLKKFTLRYQVSLKDYSCSTSSAFSLWARVITVVSLFYTFFSFKFNQNASTEKSLSKLLKDGWASLDLDYRGKFDLVLKSMKDGNCKMKVKFIALEWKLHISKTATSNRSKYIQNSESKIDEKG